MSDDNNNNIDISEFLGKEIDKATFDKLKIDSRIVFPDRPVTSPSAVSNGEGDFETGEPDPDKALQDLLDNIKENEEYVKTLEDMRDDLIKDMKIPPANDTIMQAAKQLGSPDGNITKDIYDKAKIIASPDFSAITTLGFIPKLSALLGDGRIYGPSKNCNEITQEIFDDFTIALQDSTPEEAKASLQKTIDETIADTNEQFEDKMDNMFTYIVNKLFWNHIWGRIWSSVFDVLEKMIAKPIDVIVLILKWKSLTREHFYEHGPVHKLLNKFKIFMLCIVPKAAWSDYVPEKELMVYMYSKNPVLHGMQHLDVICGEAAKYAECVTKVENISDGELPEGENIEREAKTTDKLKQFFNAEETGENAECLSSNAHATFANLKDGKSSGVNADCMKAAQVVLEAIYNDAKYNTKE